MLFFVRWYFTDISERLKQDDDNDDDDDNNEEDADAVDDDAGWRSENKGEWISRWVTTESQPVTPEPSFSSYKSHKRLNRSFQLIDIDRSSQVLSINQTNNQPINPSLHKIGVGVTTAAKKNNQSPKSRASPRLKIGHVAPILGVFGVP